MSASTKNRKKRSNRKNAKKSTGPKTDHGKAVSSQNGIKHGLYAKRIIIDSPHLKENRHEYLALVHSLREELNPTTAFQHHLVLIIANSLWRRQRVISAETAQINSQLDRIDSALKWKSTVRRGFGADPDDEALEEYDREILVGQRSIPNDKFSLNLLRYEMRLDRQMTRAFKLLQMLKAQEAATAASDSPHEESPETPPPDVSEPAAVGRVRPRTRHNPTQPDTPPPDSDIRYPVTIATFTDT